MTQVLPPLREPIYSVSEVKVGMSVVRAVTAADVVYELYHEDMGKFERKFGSLDDFARKMFPEDFVSQAAFVATLSKKLEVDIPTVPN